MSDPIRRLNEVLSGRYVVDRDLGEGGMATVYLADDLRHDRKVAIKVLKPELAAVVGAERFLAEIRTTANLQHPHILPLFDSGEADGFLYYVMPYVEGESLRERLEVDSGRVEPKGWIADGRIIADWRASEASTDRDIVLIGIEHGTLEPLLAGSWVEREGRVSPDGRWIAYESRVTGSREIYVRSFPDLGRETRITREGTSRMPDLFRIGPFWDPDGSSLVYLEDGAAWRVALEMDGPTASRSSRTRLFTIGENTELIGTHPDGRLLIKLTAGPSGVAGEPPWLMLVTDLVAELRARSDDDG